MRFAPSLAAFIGLVGSGAGACLEPTMPSGNPELTQTVGGTRTYRFSATIQSNDGVAPFEVGKKITGKFTYDLSGKKNPTTLDWHGRYRSGKNAIGFQFGELKFLGAGEINVNVSTYGRDELFTIVAYDLVLPKGWDIDHKQGSQSYSFMLQNAPSRGVFASPAIPQHLKLADFKDFQEVRLDFFHGVKFPGGEVKKRAIVMAKVESLEEEIEETTPPVIATLPTGCLPACTLAPMTVKPGPCLWRMCRIHRCHRSCSLFAFSLR
jgi:hypothetical protein